MSRKIDRKYFQPKAYVRKAFFTSAKVLLALKIPLTVRTRVNDVVIIFNATSYTEFVLRARESYRREEVTMFWLDHVVGPQDVVYDIGANVGAYSLYAGKRTDRVNNGQKVYAFEPAFTNFFSLCRNIELNKLNDIIIPFPLAFGQEREETAFFLRSTQAGAALHGVSHPSSEGTQFVPKFHQGVSVTSLDSFVQNSGIAFPNHLKIDVDGSELEIIKGARQALLDTRLRSIMIEINEDISQGRIETLITNSGFEEDRREKWKSKNTFNKLYLRK